MNLLSVTSIISLITIIVLSTFTILFLKIESAEALERYYRYSYALDDALSYTLAWYQHHPHVRAPVMLSLELDYLKNTIIKTTLEESSSVIAITAKLTKEDEILMQKQWVVARKSKA